MRIPSIAPAASALALVMLAIPLSAQELDPRAYVRAPVNSTFAVAGFAYSHGGVLTDPTLPVTDLQASVEMPSLGVGRSFAMFGKTAQAFVALPYAWAQASGNVLGDFAKADRAGLADMRMRLAVLVHGGPAANVLEIAKAPRRTIIGTSFTVSAPSGQFFSNKLVNIGTNRWAFKPEAGMSHPVGQKWLIDAYVGVWLFTGNDSFYPGTARRTQEPMGTFQGHISYNFGRLMWAAFDATYYVGGRSTVEGVAKDDRQANARVGGTLAVPVGRRHSVKLAVAKGAIVRVGSDFTTVSVAWQTAWVPRPKAGTR